MWHLHFSWNSAVRNQTNSGLYLIPCWLSLCWKQTCRSWDITPEIFGDFKNQIRTWEHSCCGVKPCDLITVWMNSFLWNACNQCTFDWMDCQCTDQCYEDKDRSLCKCALICPVNKLALVRQRKTKCWSETVDQSVDVSQWTNTLHRDTVWNVIHKTFISFKSS